MRTAFLTGGTGFLGGHVARALSARAWKVRALAREESRAGDLTAIGAEIIGGDLSAMAELESGCRGSDAIVHVAGLVKARTLDEYRQVNVRGTESLLHCASRVAPEALLVLVSSQAAAGPARDGRPVTESDAPRPVSWYGLSKRESEEAVARLWPGPWIVIRPAVVYGPGDRGLLTMFRAATRGLVPVPGGTRRIQLVAAEDAGPAIASAAERRDLAGRSGFLCDPAAVAIQDLCRLLAALPEKPARLLRVPDLVVRAAGAIETWAETVTRRSLAFNADKAREILAGDWLCDPGPLLRDLGVSRLTPLEAGLRRTWNWYKDCGWLAL